MYEAKKYLKKLAGCWAPDINILVNVSDLRYSKQIEFQEELFNKPSDREPDFFKYLHFKYKTVSLKITYPFLGSTNFTVRRGR